MLEHHAADSDVVVCIGWDATGCARVHPENHEHVVLLWVRVVKIEASSHCSVHQVTLGRLKLNLQRPHTGARPSWHPLIQKDLEVGLALRKQGHVGNDDATPIVRLERIRLDHFFKLIRELRQS